ncbi:MAG: hypothetical protein QXJ68_06295 [Methanocellales archaeon]
MNLLKENLNIPRDQLINLLLDELLEREGFEPIVIHLISIALHLHRALEAKPQAEAEAQVLFEANFGF